MKMSVKEIKNVVNEVIGRKFSGVIWIDYYKVKGGKRVRMKWWGLMVSDEELEEIRKRLGEKFWVGRNRGDGSEFGRWGVRMKKDDLVVRVMWDDLRFRKYEMK